MKVNGVLCWPEFQRPSWMQVGLHAPEVVEWKPLDQTHVTVSPTVIVVTFVPLTESTKLLPPCPTNTMCPVGVGVSVGVMGVFVKVFVNVLVFVNVFVNVGVGDEGVGVRVGDPGVNVGVKVLGVFVNVFVLVIVIVGVSVTVSVGVTGGAVGVGTGGVSGAKVRSRNTAIWPRVTAALGQ